MEAVKTSKVFNKYFSNIGSNLSSNIQPPEDINFERFLPAGIDLSHYLRPTNYTEVDNIVRSKNSNSSEGNKLNLKVKKIHFTNNFGRFCGIH